MPDHMIDNEYIKLGYRINHTGFCGVLATLFKCHNETFNVWTHFLGKISAFCIMIFILFYYSNMKADGMVGFYEYKEWNLSNNLETQDQLVNVFEFADLKYGQMELDLKKANEQIKVQIEKQVFINDERKE